MQTALIAGNSYEVIRQSAAKAERQGPTTILYGVNYKLLVIEMGSLSDERKI